VATLLFACITSGRVPLAARAKMLSFPSLSFNILRSLATAKEIVGVASDSVALSVITTMGGKN
jgi:hypothetical protein